MKRLRAATLMTLLTMSGGIALAVPVAYQLRFEVTQLHPNFAGVDSRINVGDVYSGSFLIDDAILQTQGINRPGSISSFSVSFGWGGFVFPSALVSDPFSVAIGFRGPGGFGNSPGFDISNSVITNVRGGVLSGGDAYFIDFSTDITRPLNGDPTCITGPGNDYCGNAPGRFYARLAVPDGAGGFGNTVAISGLMSVAPAAAVPEPSTFGLVALGGMIAAVRAARRQRRYVPASR